MEMVIVTDELVSVLSVSLRLINCSMSEITEFRCRTCVDPRHSSVIYKLPS